MHGARLINPFTSFGRKKAGQRSGLAEFELRLYPIARGAKWKEDQVYPVRSMVANEGKGRLPWTLALGVMKVEAAPQKDVVITDARTLPSPCVPG